jgi:hypothetical protein
MPKQERHGLKEYFYFIDSQAFGAAGSRVIAHIPIPVAARVKRAYIAEQLGQSGSATTITFKVNGNELLSNGLNARIVIASGSAAPGRVLTVDFSERSGNSVNESEDGDAIADSGTLVISTDGSGVAGTGSIMVVFGP